MHDQINFLKRAVQRGDTMGVLNCYVVKDGLIMARDGSMQAGTNFPALVSDDFNVPAGELEAILGRVKTDVDLVHNEGVVTVRGRRLKIEIACIVDEPPSVTLPVDGWKPLPPGFQAVLKLASGFILDKNENHGVRLKGDRVTTINNRAGIDIQLPGLNATECAMTSQCMEFILAADNDPTGYHQTQDAIAFRWKNESWVRAQLLQKPFPSTADRVFAGAGEECPVIITDEWREAYQDLAALAEDVVEMHHDKLRVVKMTSNIESAVETPMPEDEIFYWSILGLDPVIAVATQWNPAAWPKPAVFKGPNFRGVVVGTSPG